MAFHQALQKIPALDKKIGKHALLYFADYLNLKFSYPINKTQTEKDLLCVR